MSADIDDLDLELAGIDDGGNNAPNVHWDEARYAWVYRASAVNACSLQLGLFRQGMEGSPPPPDMLRRFRDGHLHEPAIVAEIQRQRPTWKVHPKDPHTGEQYETEYWIREADRDNDVTGIVVVGHIDGLAVNLAMNPDSRIVEAKALSKANYEKFMKALERGNVWEQYPYYRDSITVYMHSLEVPVFYGVKNKDSGEVHVFDLDEPPGDMEEIVDRIRAIEVQAANDALPDDCDRRSWPCPMWRFHPDDEVGDDPEAIMAAATGQVDADYDVDELEVLCREYDSFRASEKEAGAQKKETGRKIMDSFLVFDDKVESANYRVTTKQHTWRGLDEEAMRNDGIDLEKYRIEKVTEYPSITKKRGRK